MTLWVERADVRSCLECIRGSQGKISIRRGHAKSKGHTHKKEGAGSSGKDWKDLYDCLQKEICSRLL